MAARILDVTGWEIVLLGDYWHHVSHERRLATSGWGTREGAERNARGYREDAGTLNLMSARYATFYPD